MSIKTSLLLLIATFSTPLFAVDGVTLINQATVQAAGGFPYIINQPGSYRLSGNLVVPGSNEAIQIQAAFVTLDLGGFTISCAACAPPHGNYGMEVQQSFTTIMNGTISKFYSHGIFFFKSGAKIVNVTLDHDGVGVTAADDLMVSDSRFYDNTDYAIYAAQGRLLLFNSFFLDNSPGVVATAGLVRGNFFAGDSPVHLKTVGQGQILISENSFDVPPSQLAGLVSTGNNSCSFGAC